VRALDRYNHIDVVFILGPCAHVAFLEGISGI